MSDGALTCLLGVLDALLLVSVPVALFTGKRSGATFTILIEAAIVACIIAFELVRRARKC